jgi:hypothetical protein
MNETHETDYYTSTEEADVTIGAVTVAAIGIVGFVTLVMVAVGIAWQARTRAKAAKDSELGAESRKLGPGVTVLRGTVETDGSEPVARIVIKQRGEQYRVKNGMRHRWTETGRTVELRPFFLAMESGERVKVEPEDDAYVVDQLDVRPGASTNERTRTAEIKAGDIVYASGRLFAPVQTNAYRAAEQGYTLRPGPDRRLFLSTEPLEERFTRRASTHTYWAIGLFAALLFTNGVMFHSYWTKLFFGQTVVATVVRPRTWTTQGKHGPIRHYGITAEAQLDDQRIALNPETSRVFYNDVYSKTNFGARAAKEPITVPFLVVPPTGEPNNIGTRPALNLGIFFLAWFEFLGVSIGYFWHARHIRPWYERPRVIDVGAGALGSGDALE